MNTLRPRNFACHSLAGSNFRIPYLYILALVGIIGFGNSSKAQQPTPTPIPAEVSVTPALNDDWGHIHQEFVAETKARADQIQVVFLGDSITARWTRGAGGAIWAERYAGLGINLGISADSTQHVLWRLQNGELAALHPKMVLLMIGTNNLGGTVDEVVYGVWSVVAEIRKTHPETRVLVEAIFPKERGTDGPKIPQVNALLSKLDDGKMVKYIDFGSGFLKPDGTLNRDWFPDGTHPEKPEAFKVWADAMQPTIDEWLKLPPVPNVPPPACPVPAPENLTSSTPAPRNDWLFRFKRQLPQAAKGNCDLLFLGGVTMTLWDRSQDIFKKEYGADKPLNFANWGSRTENILWQIDNAGLTGLQPKVIVVQVQEDLTDPREPASVVAGMDAITKRLQKLYPQAKILLLGGFPMGAKPTDPLRTKIDDYNTQLAKLADNKSVYFLDVGKVFIKDDGSLEQIPAPNGFSPASLQRWADAQRDEIAKLMQATP